MKMFNLNDIPLEVMQVQLIMFAGHPVGRTTYDICHRIIKKYPQYFPWEHLYHSIPSEIHEAYELEAYGPKPTFEEIIAEFESGDVCRPKGGIKELLESKPSYTFNHDPNFDIGKELQKMFDRKAENERKELERECRLRKIWNKHYSKYKLKFSTNKHFL